LAELYQTLQSKYQMNLKRVSLYVIKYEIELWHEFYIVALNGF